MAASRSVIIFVVVSVVVLLLLLLVVVVVVVAACLFATRMNIAQSCPLRPSDSCSFHIQLGFGPARGEHLSQPAWTAVVLGTPTPLDLPSPTHPTPCLFVL